jgi:hypothetical protein
LTAGLSVDYVWTLATWSSKFVKYGDTSGAVYPTALVAGDPAGTYNWGVTLTGGGQSVTEKFKSSHGRAQCKSTK